jgi:hypothetical protein
MISFFNFSKYWSSGGMKLTGENRSNRGRTCPSATLSSTNSTWTDPGSNLGLCCERPATNRLSHGTAKSWTILSGRIIYLPCPSTLMLYKSYCSQKASYWDIQEHICCWFLLNILLSLYFSSFLCVIISLKKRKNPAKLNLKHAKNRHCHLV